MKGDVLPPDNHVGLHCAPRSFIDHDAGGRPVGVNIHAFRVDQDGISVDWLEFEGRDSIEQFRLLCARIKLTRDVRPSHCIGIMQVGEIVDCGTVDQPLTVVHDPIGPPKPNLGHALIQGIMSKNDPVLLDLSTLVTVRPFT